MPKMKLTAQAVKGLPTPGVGRVDYQDTVLPGLVLRVASTGAKSYSVSYWKDGARPRVTLGLDESSPRRGPGANVEHLSLADARERAKAILKAARIGADPAAEKREAKAGVTFAELAREYVERWAKARKSAKGAREDALRVENVLIPRWGRMKARDVRKRDVVALLDEIADSGRPIARNRMQSLLSKLFNFGIRRDLIEHNPALNIDREPENVRKRPLSDDELRVVLPLFREAGLAGLGFRLALLTGQRPGEVFGMRWSEIDGDTWRLPRERCKNRRAMERFGIEYHSVPLSPAARAVLAELRQYDRGSGFVFPSRVGNPESRRSKRPPAPFTNYAKQARRLYAQSRIEPGWEVYDLRSTCLTGLQNLGFPPHVTSAVANHLLDSVTARHYAGGTYETEKRDALTRWGEHVEKIDPTTSAKVVKIRRARG